MACDAPIERASECLLQTIVQYSSTATHDLCCQRRQPFHGSCSQEGSATELSLAGCFKHSGTAACPARLTHQRWVQTIIECLKQCCTGDLPPNIKSGQGFIHDPKVCAQLPPLLLHVCHRPLLAYVSSSHLYEGLNPKRVLRLGLTAHRCMQRCTHETGISPAAHCRPRSGREIAPCCRWRETQRSRRRSSCASARRATHTLSSSDSSWCVGPCRLSCLHLCRRAAVL